MNYTKRDDILLSGNISVSLHTVHDEKTTSQMPNDWILPVDFDRLSLTAANNSQDVDGHIMTLLIASSTQLDEGNMTSNT